MNKKPKCKLTEQDGNIFNLIAIASKALKTVKMEKEAKEMREKIFKCGGYDEALVIISEYVEVK